MNKEVFRQRTLQVLEEKYRFETEIATQVIDKMKDNDFTEYEDSFFAPKAFCKALADFNADNVTSRHFSNAFVRKHKKAVRFFLHNIIYNRF